MNDKPHLNNHLIYEDTKKNNQPPPSPTKEPTKPTYTHKKTPLPPKKAKHTKHW